MAGECAIRLHEYGHFLLISSGFHGTELLKNFREKGVDGLWFRAALDVIVNHCLLKMGCKEISYLPLAARNMRWDKLARGSAAQIFLRSSGLAREKKIRLKAREFLERDYNRDDIAFLETADAKLIQWSRLEHLPNEDFFALILKLEQIFGRSSEKCDDWGNIITAEEIPYQLSEYELDILSEQIDTAQKENLYSLLNIKNRARNKQILKDVVRKSMLAPIANWNNWGKMEIIHLPLTKVQLTIKNSRKFLPGFVGTFRYPHRALLPAGDGAAFAYRQKSKGGTILLDCSGSMRLSVGEISNFLCLAPMLTVAGYSSSWRKGGSLAIFIKNGRITDEQTVEKWYKEKGSGNVIDGPALGWLIKQRKPLIWISDGRVTGIYDMCSKNLNLEIAILMKLGKIKQFTDIESCLKAFHAE